MNDVCREGIGRVRWKVQKARHKRNGTCSPGRRQAGSQAVRYQRPGEEIGGKQLPVERLKSESRQTAAAEQGNNANSDEYQKLKLNCVL